MKTLTVLWILKRGRTRKNTRDLIESLISMLPVFILESTSNDEPVLSDPCSVLMCTLRTGNFRDVLLVVDNDTKVYFAEKSTDYLTKKNL